MTNLDTNFQLSPFGDFLGIEQVSSDDTKSLCRMSLSSSHFNAGGRVHGGVLLRRRSCRKGLKWAELKRAAKGRGIEVARLDRVKMSICEQAEFSSCNFTLKSLAFCGICPHSGTQIMISPFVICFKKVKL